MPHEQFDSTKYLKRIVENDLCTSCGTCAGVCPTNAISMLKNLSDIFVPKIHNAKCNNCGLCAHICPSYQVKLKEINKNVFNKLPEDYVVGNYINSYLAHATNIKTRMIGQSGGIITSLLLYALKEKLIDGAILVKMKKTNEPQIFIARSEEDIISGSKSKYCPVPMNIILKTIKNERGKYAYVGLPCHMHGIRNAENILPWLKERVVLHFGLICEGTLNFSFIKYLSSRIGIDESLITHITYRDKSWRGWPGDLLVTLKNGELINLTKDYRTSVKPFFTPWRCYLCFDKLNTLADVSIGDPWLSTLQKDKLGSCIVVTRNTLAENLINQASGAGIIIKKTISIEHVLEAQKPHKKAMFAKRYRKMAYLEGKNAPICQDLFNQKKLNSTIWTGLILVFFYYLLFKIARKTTGKMLINLSPMPVLKLVTTLIRMFNVR